MRTKLSWVLTALGALSAVAGLAVMLILGPDGRFATGPHAVKTDGIAVVTAPKVITWADVRIDVLAEVPAEKPVFVGLGNTVDVQNYINETARLEVTKFHTPWKVKTRQLEGKAGLPGAPTALDWWLARSAGRGGASISATLPDETVSLAILSVGDSNLSGLKVTLAYGIKGGFVKGVGLLLLGAGAILLGRQLRRGETIWTDDDDDEDEVVYVYVDEDGVEHEISPEEAEGYEIVEDEDEAEAQDEAQDVVDAPPPPVGAPAVKPKSGFGSAFGSLVARKPKATPAVPESEDEEVVYIYVDEDGVEHEITADQADAYEFIDEVVVEVDDEPTNESEPEPAPQTSEAEERVIYVMVDENGVEHEVSEDELADFEIVDEEEKP